MDFIKNILQKYIEIFPGCKMDERLRKKAFGYFKKEGFVCYYWFIGWWHWSLGINIYPLAPNLEIHLPFGFIRFGIQDRWMVIENKKL